MNSSIPGKNVLPKWSVLLALLTFSALAMAAPNGGGPPKQSTPAPHASAPAPHPSAPAARPSAPAQRPGGAPNRGPGGNASRPGTPGANNRGPGGNASRPGTPGGNNANNRGPGGSNANRAGTGANNRGPNGANANKGGPGGANKAGQGGANKGGPANANKGGPGGANKGGANANNRAGGAGRPRQPTGTKQVALKSGGKATFRKDGKVRSIQTAKGMKIEHGVRGGRHIESVHNGRRVVSMGRHGGYSQRAYYNHGGHVYVQRTYYSGGRYYAYGYRSYNYGGYPYYGYAPPYYYGPAYYGWAYNPWPAPVTYGWGWGGQPWYGYYGPYFQPYPVYPTAAFWLTDFLLAASLQAAYQASQASEEGLLQPPQMGPETSNVIASLWSTDPMIAANLEASYGQYMLGAAAPPASAAKGGATQIPADVKQGISDEMKNEIAAEQAAAKGGDQKPAGGEEVPAALDPKIRYFVVSTDLDATTSEGDECGLTAGDVVYRVGDTPDDDHMVDATVKASKKDDCAVGATVGVDTSDLQEMHNQLRIQMDAGLKELADKQGKNGLPAAPDTKTTTGEVPAPAPDTNAAKDLQDQKTEADQAEAEAKQSNN
jgi:hypothetical protein